MLVPASRCSDWLEPRRSASLGKNLLPPKAILMPEVVPSLSRIRCVHEVPVLDDHVDLALGLPPSAVSLDVDILQLVFRV